MCCLRSVGSFLGVFPSDLLPQLPIARSGTLIANIDPHMESGSHWLAIHVQPRSHSSFYFNGYGLPPFVPSVESFLHRNNIVQNYNAVHLQGPTNTVCDKYCCLFALYMDRGYTPRQFVGLLPTASADRVVADLFASDFGPLRGLSPGGSVVVVALRGAYILPISYFTRKAYSSSYWSFFRFQRHLKLRSYTCVQRYIRVERLSSAQSTS